MQTQNDLGHKSSFTWIIYDLAINMLTHWKFSQKQCLEKMVTKKDFLKVLTFRWSTRFFYSPAGFCSNSWFWSIFFFWQSVWQIQSASNHNIGISFYMYSIINNKIHTTMIVSILNSSQMLCHYSEQKTDWKATLKHSHQSMSVIQ